MENERLWRYGGALISVAEGFMGFRSVYVVEGGR